MLTDDGEGRKQEATPATTTSATSCPAEYLRLSLLQERLLSDEANTANPLPAGRSHLKTLRRLPGALLLTTVVFV